MKDFVNHTRLITQLMSIKTFATDIRQYGIAILGQVSGGLGISRFVNRQEKISLLRVHAALSQISFKVGGSVLINVAGMNHAASKCD